MSSGARLIGRDDDLARLERLASDPSVPAIVIAGAAGVGKSSLAGHVTDSLRSRDVPVAIVRATSAAATIPLGAFSHLIEPPSAATASVLAEARRVITMRAQGRELLLWIDDAHLLDNLSAALVLTLADEPHVCPLVTVRSGEPTPDAITALWKDAGAPRIDLLPLDAPASDQLAEQVAGASIDEPSHVQFRTAAQGNPLAVCELVRGAVAAGNLVDDFGVLRLRAPLRITDRIIELVGDGLNDLSARELDTLALIAFAEPVDVAVVERCGRGDELAALERHGVVAVERAGDQGADATNGESFGVLLARLSHPLHGEAAVDRVGELMRRNLLRELVDDLAPRVKSDDDGIKFAAWSLRAGLPISAEALLAAAASTWARGDHHQTAEFAAAAWELDHSAASGHILGYALGRTGRSVDAERVLADVWEQADDDRSRMLIAQTRCDNLFRGLGRADDALMWNARAEAAVADADTRSELVAHRAMLLIQSGQVSDGLRLAEPMLGEDVADRPFVAAAYAAGLGHAVAGRPAEVLDIVDRALAVHERVWRDDLFSTEPTVHHITRTLALIESGRLGDADQITEIGVGIAAQAGRGYNFGFFAMLRGLVQLRRGRIVECGRYCRESVAALLGAGYPGAARWALSGVAITSALTGDQIAAEEAVREIDRLDVGNPIRLYEGLIDDAVGWVQLGAGQVERARDHFAQAAEREAEVGAAATASLLAHSLTRAGDATRSLPLLRESSATTDAELIECRLEFADAAAALDADRLERAGEHFASLGADLDAADAFAEAAVHRAAGSDARGAARCVRRSDALASICPTVTTPARRALRTIGVTPLSRREREVAHLASLGRPSRDIADELGVAVRTVDNHLQQVYRKLGLRKRADLADVLGLAPENRTP